jgi:carbon monoxide dehydrogenase subunit G
MAEHTHRITTWVSADEVWELVSDMDRWAPLLLGYQSHEQHGDRESVWTIKGDVGTLTRVVDFRVQITEWVEPSQVEFTLEGLGEPMVGDGSFQLEPLGPGEAAAAEPLTTERLGLLTRWWAALVRRLLGGGDRAATAAAGTGPPAVRLTFRLNLTPGGPMAPMLEAMIKPVMVATAEDLAQRIVARLEGREVTA